MSRIYDLLILSLCSLECPRQISPKGDNKGLSYLILSYVLEFVCCPSLITMLQNQKTKQWWFTSQWWVWTERNQENMLTQRTQYHLWPTLNGFLSRISSVTVWSSDRRRQRGRRLNHNMWDSDADSEVVSDPLRIILTTASKHKSTEIWCTSSLRRIKMPQCMLIRAKIQI